MKKIKSKILLSLLCIACLLSSLLVFTSCGNKGSKNLIYELNKDGTAYTVTGYDGNKEKVTIPEVYKKLPVTAIADEAFKGNEVIKTLSIPDSVKDIGDNAFAECKVLENLTLPKKLDSLGTSCFRQCPMLKKVTIPDGIDELHVATFYECTSLQTVELPASLTEVSYLAFMGCDNLANISIEKNSKYHSADNCLIETDTKTLIVGAANSVIPSDGSVENIGENAFYERAALSTIVIPDSVKKIGKLAFSGCTALRYVRMTGISVIGERAFSGCRAIKYLLVSNELQSIEEYALSQCNTLRTIYMKGNAADWEKVSCAQTVESALEKITVYYYSETEPETEGNFWHFEKGDVISPWIKGNEK